MKSNVIAEKSEEFAVRIVNLYKHLTLKKKELIMSKQIFRCGTSIGANISESRNAQSSSDFVNKLNIALKEADETAFWLRLLKRTEFISAEEFESMGNDLNEIISLLVSIIKTTKNNNSMK